MDGSINATDPSARAEGSLSAVLKRDRFVQRPDTADSMLSSRALQLARLPLCIGFAVTCRCAEHRIWRCRTGAAI